MKNQRIRLRNLKFEDYVSLKDSMVKAYPDMKNAIWREDHIRKLMDIFPEGQLCVTVNGQVVAVALSIIVDYRGPT